jgi:hypothetical protein
VGGKLSRMHEIVKSDTNYMDIGEKITLNAIRTMITGKSFFKDFEIDIDNEEDICNEEDEKIII